MYTPQFEYQRATSVADAISMLSQNREAKLIAGGHSLLPALKLRLSEPPLLIDIGRIAELKQITPTRDGSLTIGALCTHAEIAASSMVRQLCPALAMACGNVGDMHVRNWGTLGGNLAHADPASDPPTVLVAVGARLNIQGPQGARAVNAEDFFVDLFTTALRPGEIITEVVIPATNLRMPSSGYVKMAHPASRYAVVGVGVALHMEGNRCQSARVAVGGATPKATRAPGAEAALTGSTLDDAALDAAAKALSNDIGDGAMGDIFASADYRRAVAGVYLKRAIRATLS